MREGGRGREREMWSLRELSNINRWGCRERGENNSRKREKERDMLHV